MALTEQSLKTLEINDIKRVEYWDSRYYQVTYNDKKEGEVKKYFPSVTEILGGGYPKDFIAKWRGDVGNERADQIVREAFALGSFVHFGAEIIGQGGAVIYNPLVNPIYTDDEIKQFIEKYKRICICRTQREFVQLHRIWQFFDALKPTYIETEQTVFSIKHEYAGTLDLVLEVPEGEYAIAGSKPLYLEKGLYLCDYKTGKGTDYSNHMQMAAYVKAVIEGVPTAAKNFKGGLLLHTNAELVKNGIEGFKATHLNMEEIEDAFQDFLHVYKVYQIKKPTPDPKRFSMPSILSYAPVKEEKPKAKKGGKK